MNLTRFQEITLLLVSVFLVISIFVIILIFRLYRKKAKAEQEARESLQNAQHANRAKTVFLSNMSHDIRTPMNAVLGYTDLIAKNLDNKDKVKEYLAKMKTSGDFLLSLINNVLEMSEIESGKVALDEGANDARFLMKEIMTIFDHAAKEKNIELTLDIDIQHDIVLFDKVKIREIYTNLVSNAIKYTNDNGKINVCLTEIPSDNPEYATFKGIVQDSGIGMSESYLPHLFETFVREHTVTENKINGTGLGVPIVKELVNLMGGTISVESKLGVGTKFTIIISHKICSQKELADSLQVPKRDKNFSFDGKRILLAEDNDFNAEIATIILTEVGMKVDVASDGIICIDKLTKAPPSFYDCILMDIQMPNMNGYKATSVIRKLEDPEKAKIPIIAMTANAFEKDKNLALKSGMNGHLSKPINVKELLDKLSMILS